MTEPSNDGTIARPPFTKHFFFILLSAAIVYAAMDTFIGARLPSDAAISMAGYLGSGSSAALLSLLVYWITWKGGIGRNPIGAAWGAAAFVVCMVLIDHLSDAKLLP